MNELNEQNQDDAIQNSSKSYLLGSLGALIGAFVASIPWILVYVYGNMIFSALAIIIAIGALKGYQIFKGTIDKKLPIVITVVSLLAVIVSTLLIIPMLLIIKDGYPVTIYNLQLLYENSDFLSAIIQDLIVSIAFTAIGISGVVVNINRQIKDSKEPLQEIKISSTLSNPNYIVNQEQVVNSVKNVFANHDAMSKENAIDKNTILTELQELENGKYVFNVLRNQQIIRKYKGKYYFSEKAEKNPGYRTGLLFKRTLIIFVVILVLTFAVTFGIIFWADNNSSSNTTQDNITDDISQDTVQTTSYTLSDFGMKITAPINMTLAIGSDLDYMFGSGASEFYNFALYNQDDFITAFTQDLDKDELDSYYDYLKGSFEEDEEFKIISDYKDETISGFKFKTIEAQITVDDVLFNDVCLIYFENDKLFVLEYSYPAENAEKSRDVLKEIIQKLN